MKTQNGHLSNNRKTRLESAIKSAGKVELHLNKKKKNVIVTLMDKKKKIMFESVELQLNVVSQLPTYNIPIVNYIINSRNSLFKRVYSGYGGTHVY